MMLLHTNRFEVAGRLDARSFWSWTMSFALSSNYALILVSAAAYNEVVGLRNVLPRSRGSCGFAQ